MSIVNGQWSIVNEEGMKRGFSRTEGIRDFFGEFTQLAALYRAEVELGKSFGEACAAVSQFTLNHFPYLQDHVGAWEMFNMAFRNETHCPYKLE